MMLAYVSSESEPGFAGGIVLALSYSARTDLPAHTLRNASPASGGAIVPFVKVFP